MPTAQGKEEIVLETAGGLTELLMNVAEREGGGHQGLGNRSAGAALAACLLVAYCTWQSR